MASVSQFGNFEGITDEALVQRILDGDTPAFEIIMRRHNQRLYRIARAVVQDEMEAEDVMQDAYVKAYQNLGQFEGRASFATWLSRIALYEALSRVRKRKRVVELDKFLESGREAMQPQSSLPSPEHSASHSELSRLLEQEIDALPEAYRTICMLRDVEEMDVTEVAELLGIRPENVKTRLHRAHALLRKRILERTGEHSRNAFLFQASRCDRVVTGVFARLAAVGNSENVAN